MFNSLRSSCTNASRLPLGRIACLFTAFVAASAARLFAETTYATPYAVTTLAGSPAIGITNGTGTDARFYSPFDVVADSSGNFFVADSGNSTIRKITPAGVVSTFAGMAGSRGSTDGTGSAARFASLAGIAIDSQDNLYVADPTNYTIRKITPAAVVTTIAGVPGTPSATESDNLLLFPYAVTVDQATDTVYVADSSAVRKVTGGGALITVAGSVRTRGSVEGVGTAARFGTITGLQVGAGGVIYVADLDGRRIRKIAADGTVMAFAGAADNAVPTDGTGSAARFGSLYGLGIDSDGNLYASDGAIRKITPAAVVTTVAGMAGASGYADGAGSAARFSIPDGIAVDPAGNLYVADRGNHKIRKINPAGDVTTFAGAYDAYGTADGLGSAARFDRPRGLAVDSLGNYYVADENNHAIRKISPSGDVTTFAGGTVASTAAGADNDGTGTAARFVAPFGVAIDSQNNVYVADYSLVRKITPAGVVTTLAGDAIAPGWADGVGAAARFKDASGIAVDASGNVFVADSFNHVIRKITPDRTVTTIAGTVGITGYQNGTGTAARFGRPSFLAIDAAGTLYISDASKGAVRKMTAAGEVTTLAGNPDLEDATDGTGTSARFGTPCGLAVDPDGNVYVADSFAVRRITPGGVVTTLAGDFESRGHKDAAGAAARFTGLQGLTQNAAGELIIVDTSNNIIRKAVSALPLVTAHSAVRQVLLPGGTLNLSVTATSPDSVTYQWFHVGRPIAGATSSSLSRPNVTDADRGAYWVEITNGNGITRSVPMFVNVAPAITQVRAWGANSYGQATVPIALNTAIAISAGGSHALVLEQDGSVLAWGHNGYGQSTVPPELTGVVAVSAGATHSLALKSDGTVVAWGDVGPGFPAGLDNVVAIAAGATHSLALKSDGTVVAWGHDTFGSTVVPPGLSSVIAISAGQMHSLAQQVDGTLVPWHTGSLNNIPAGLGFLAAFEEGDSGQIIALLSDGTVTQWGTNHAAVPPGLTGVRAVSAGDRNNYALRNDGTVVTWGTGYYGQETTPPVDLAQVIAISGGTTFGLALRDASSDAPPVITLSPSSQTITEEQGVTFTAAATGTAPLGYQWRKDGVDIAGATLPTLTLSQVIPANAGSYDIVVTNHMGSATSAIASLMVRALPVITSLSPRRHVLALGQDVALTVTATGTGPLHYQWLHNGREVPGATGTALSLTHLTFASNGWYVVRITDDHGVRHSPGIFVNAIAAKTEVLGWSEHSEFSWIKQVPEALTDVTEIALGFKHALALKADGTVTTWGLLGNSPALVSTLSDVVAISSGPLSNRAIALKSDGTVVTWRYDGVPPDSVPEGLRDVVAVSDGGGQFLALKSDGTVVAWGGGYDESDVPAGLTDAIAIAGHSVALKRDGSVIDWYESTERSNNVPPGLSNAQAIAEGYIHVLALKSDGTVVGWGNDGGGRATAPAGLNDAVAIAAGYSHSLALKSDGTVVAWGSNSFGEGAIPDGLARVLAVEAGYYTTLVLRDATSDTLPIMTEQPASVAVLEGRIAYFSATAAAVGPISYQWQIAQNGNGAWANLSNGGRYYGADTNTLQIATVDFGPDHGDQFRCIASNDQGSVTSNPATLSVTIPRADFNGDGMPDLLLQHLATGALRIRLLEGASVITETALGGISNRWSIAATADFNNDGRSDLLLQNSQTGERKVRFMYQTTTQSEVSLETVPPDWSIAAAADFNGDDQVDILWQHVTGLRHIWFMDGTTRIGDASLGSVSREWSIAAAADFNGDGKPDLVWEHTSGLRYVWFMNGTTLIGGDSLGSVAPEWSIAMAADFNGDAQTDILWQNTVTGQCFLWYLNGVNQIAYADLGLLPAGWSIAGGPAASLPRAVTHDFNHDGKPDLLVQHTTGIQLVWFMEGTGRIGSSYLGSAPVEWTIAATGDFNDDGQTDMVLQNLTTGERKVRTTNAWPVEINLETVTADWSIVAAADFNGDGKPDLLWQHPTGLRHLWFMNGTARIGDTSLGSVPPEWSIAAAADFNGDGKPDIVWQHASGLRYVWFMDGAAVIGDASLGSVAAEWSLAMVADLNADGQNDIVWQNTVTGQHYLWLMNGILPIGYADLGSMAVEWSIVN